MDPSSRLSQTATHSTRSATSPLKTAVLISMSIAILVPSMLGFVMKFIEFVHTFQQDNGGAFAITPMLNYGLASLGFLCMLLWAAANGMFHDIERPKFRMLEIEELLEGQPLPGPSHLTKPLTARETE